MAISKAFQNFAGANASATSTTSSAYNSTGFTHVVGFYKHEGATTAVTPSATNVAAGNWTGNASVKKGNSVSDSWGQFFWAKIDTPGAAQTMTADHSPDSRPFRTLIVWLVNATSGAISKVDEKSDSLNNSTPTAGTLSNAGGASVVSFMGVAEYSSVTYTPGSAWTEDADTNPTNATFGESRGAETTTSITADCTSSLAMDWAAVAVMFKEQVSGTPALEESSWSSVMDPPTDNVFVSLWRAVLLRRHLARLGFA
jgi:hypothetical protein